MKETGFSFRRAMNHLFVDCERAHMSATGGNRKENTTLSTFELQRTEAKTDAIQRRLTKQLCVQLGAQSPIATRHFQAGSRTSLFHRMNISILFSIT